MPPALNRDWRNIPDFYYNPMSVNCIVFVVLQDAAYHNFNSLHRGSPGILILLNNIIFHKFKTAF